MATDLKIVCVNVAAAHIDRLDQAARKRGMSRSALVRSILDAALGTN